MIHIVCIFSMPRQIAMEMLREATEAPRRRSPITTLANRGYGIGYWYSVLLSALLCSVEFASLYRVQSAWLAAVQSATLLTNAQHSTAINSVSPKGGKGGALPFDLSPPLLLSQKLITKQSAWHRSSKKIAQNQSQYI